MTLTSEQAYSRARIDLTTYKQIIKGDYIAAPHLNLLDAHLMACSMYLETGGQKGINRLIIEMPPRHGKTETVSKLYPTWHLGRNPSHFFMLVSYGATLAYKNSRSARNYMRSPYYNAIFPHAHLARDSKSVESWLIEKYEGGANALGITGGATGKGAHILVIDDPIKNRQEAESEVYRERTWNAFTSDLYTRLAPNGVIIIMATRWHMDDLTGRALDLNEGWVRLRLPAIAEDDDALGRDVGAPLWSTRYPLEVLEKTAQTLGEYEFASLYQQRPMASRAGLFDVSKIELVEPHEAPTGRKFKAVRFYDLAVTAKKTSDYTAGVKLGIDHDGTLYILDMYRQQRNPVDVKNDIIRNAHIDGQAVPIRLESEKAGIVQLDYLVRDPQLSGYTLDRKTPQGDKYTRAQPFASRVNADVVKMVRAPWNRALLDEMAVFPMGKHDDQVDALSGAYDMLGTHKPPAIAKTKRPIFPPSALASRRRR